MLELQVKVININLPETPALLRKCRPLYEYSWFIQRIREHLGRNETRDDAVTGAIEDCEREGILTDFVRRHGSEAVNMLFTQFNMDDALEVRYEEGREEGREEGQEKGRKEGGTRKIIELTMRKIPKGKTPETIAEELEEDVALIKRICAIVEDCGADAETDMVYRRLEAEGNF